MIWLRGRPSMKLDIKDAILTAIIVMLAGGLYTVASGVRAWRTNSKIAYYRLRRRRMAEGFLTVAAGFCLAGLAFLVAQYGEPIAYTYFPPSPTFTRTLTISPTPTISLTPTITETPTITLTPAESYTPTPSSTPYLPDAIAQQFNSVVTPNPQAVFSPLLFSRRIANYQAVDPQVSFTNPVGKLYLTYSYDFMTDGVQWTLVLLRDGELVHYETSPWGSGTGGYEYDELSLPAEDWLPGLYQVVLFVGEEWKVSGDFRVVGSPPTPTPTRTPTLTPSRTRTPFPSLTPLPSDTRWPTVTGNQP
jgi:hypothetical protein